MSAYPEKDQYDVYDLLRIVTLLRDPQDGCAWDKVQTHQSIRMNFLEEAYEAVDAIDQDDAHLMCEELGDVLMQVVFHSCIEQERGRFTFAQVCDGVCRKLIGRHPHIFTAENALQAAEVIKNWDTLKNKEKGRVTAAADLGDVPLALPALMQAAKLQKRAARYGVTEPAPAQAAERIARQTARAAQQTDSPEQAEQTVGELLFAAVALARALKVDPEQALQRADRRFLQQVTQAEQAQNGQEKKAAEEE